MNKRMKTVLMFPGQGSQIIGMGKDIYDNFLEAREVFEEVDDVLKQHLSKLIFNGDIKELTLTQNSQPAIMATSIALLKVILKQSGKDINDICDYVCGHSLGEYSAHAASKSTSLTNISHLLKCRSEAMAEAASHQESTMAAMLGCQVDQVEKLVLVGSDYGVCEIANDNGANQIVISGVTDAVNWCIENAAKFGIKKAIKLNVAGAFHSSLMQKAVPKMHLELNKVIFKKPCVPLISNVNASIISDEKEIMGTLIEQIVSRVKWRQTIEFLIDNEVNKFVEIGPGQALTTIAKRMNERAKCYSVCNTNGVEQLLNSFKKSGN